MGAAPLTPASEFVQLSETVLPIGDNRPKPVTTTRLLLIEEAAYGMGYNAAEEPAGRLLARYHAPTGAP